MSLSSEQGPVQKPIRKVEQSGDIVLACYPHLARKKTIYNQAVSIKNLRSVIDKCKQYYDK